MLKQIEQTQHISESSHIEVLMAKFSNLAYKNIRKYKNGQKLFKESELLAWEYFQPDNITESIKCKIFTAQNNRTKQIAIVVKGSEPLPSFDLESIVNDWGVSDFNLVVGKLPMQFLDFHNYVKIIKENTPNDYKIYMTGHSLGGSIVQLLCSLDENKEIETYTYNAYGVKHLLPNLKKEGYSINSEIENINNFSMSADLVSNHNEHIGNVFVVKYEKNFVQTIFSIISELPKIMTDIPFKIIKSIKYYIRTVKWFFIKINGHLMNNFTNEFTYQKYDKNNMKETVLKNLAK